MTGRSLARGSGLRVCFFLPSSRKNCRDEIGTVSLSLNQISSSGEEIEGKQSLGPLSPHLSHLDPIPCVLPLSSRNVLWLPALLWPQLPDSPWGQKGPFQDPGRRHCKLLFSALVGTGDKKKKNKKPTSC
jgi:hypothetical protein